MINDKSNFQVFANHEDALMLKKARVAYDDIDVERVRRSHLNDLENVVPWMAITAMWLNTGPSSFYAGLAIRGFVLSRCVHTLAYAIYPKQPFRALAFFVGVAITAYETVSTIIYYM